MLFSEFCKMILYYFYHDDFIKTVGDTEHCKNTIDTTCGGKLTKNKVLTKELENYFYIKIDKK